MHPIRLFVFMSVVTIAASSPRDGWSQASPTVAPAGTTVALEAARSLAREAMAYYQAGNFEGAAVGFRKADAVYAAPQYRIYEARALAKLGKVASAARAYDRVMALPVPDGAPASFAEAQRTAVSEVAELRKRVPVIRMLVTDAPIGIVVVMVDGVNVPRAGWARVEVDPGSHAVVISAAGYDGISRTLDMREGVVETVEVVMKAIPPPATRRGLLAPTPGVNIPVRPMRPMEQGPRKGVLIAGAAVAGVAAIVGVGLAIASAGKAGTASELRAGVTDCPPHDMPNIGGKCGELIAARKGLAALGSGAIAAFIGAGAVGGATLIYGLSARRAVRGAVRISPSIGGVVVDGVF